MSASARRPPRGSSWAAQVQPLESSGEPLAPALASPVALVADAVVPLPALVELEPSVTSPLPALSVALAEPSPLLLSGSPVVVPSSAGAPPRM
ncbi:MAG: hypothetical protein H6710_13875 [Myxococcales bacterium]|nr:hypothetical protein [Myxococcales bacterium]